MKKTISIIATILILHSCSNDQEKIITGTLNPNFVSIINFQTASDVKINKFIERIDSSAVKLNDAELKASSKFFYNLLKHKLIRFPSFHLKQKDNSEILIFIDKNHFRKIEKYNYPGSDTEYKVNIKLRYKEIEKDIFLCDSILEMDIKKLKKRTSHDIR